MQKYILLLFLVSIFLSNCTAVTPSPTAEVEVELPTFEPQQPPCAVFKPGTSPANPEESIFPPVSQDDWTRGPANAAVTIIVYGDFQCPYCRSLSPVLDDLLEKYPQDLRLVFRHLPLTGIHDKAMLSAQAAEAAGEQGKFWEMYDLLYDKQTLWQDLTPDQFEQWIKSQASGLELDSARFANDMERADIIAKIEHSLQFAQDNNLLFTPLIIVNGEISTLYDYNNLYDMVALLALSRRQFTTCPPAAINANKQYIATLNTEHGEVKIQLFPDKAPLAVNSFVFLAENGWYDDITFHRVIADGFAQTGDPSGTGNGNPGYLFQVEIDPSLKFDKPGMVAMYNFGQDTNGSQFFITYKAVPELNNKYTIFGQVLKGMDVLKKLTPRIPETGVITPPGDRLISVTIEEK